MMLKTEEDLNKHILESDRISSTKIKQAFFKFYFKYIHD